jgi:hypothetical protein
MRYGANSRTLRLGLKSSRSPLKESYLENIMKLINITHAYDAVFKN